MSKGSMSINKVGAILLGMLTVAAVFAATQGWFNDMLSGFLGSISYPGS